MDTLQQFKRDELELLYRLERRAILPLKWTIFLLCVLLATFFAPKYLPEFPVFLLLLFYGFSILFLTYFIGMRRCALVRIRLVSYLSFFVDVLVMTAFVFMTGGLKSDFYILFFLVVLRGAGFFPTARLNFAADLVISGLFIIALYLGQPDADTLWNRTFLIRMVLLCGVVLLSWYLMRVQVVERQNAEMAKAKLQLQTEYNRNMLESITNGVIASDREQNITTTNDSASLILGIPESTILQWRVKDLPPTLAEAFTAAYEGGVEFTDKQVEINRGKTEGGRDAVIRLSTRRILDFQGQLQGIVATFEDLSALRHAEEQLWRSERLASVGELAAGLAHELGNPIGIIKSCAGYLKKKLPPDNLMLEDLEVIDSESDRCQSLVRQLLSLASREDIQIEDVDLNLVVERAVSLVRYDQQAEGILFEKDYSDSPLIVRIDENLFIQALVNVLFNAVQVSQKKGTIRIKTAVKENANPWAVTTVQDEGAGIDQETLKRIFDPFFTTKDEGSGLGLTITNRIIERLDGNLEVTSIQGSGTTVEIDLPLYSQTKEV